jgi:molybdopterin biosynthesis enzyme
LIGRAVLAKLSGSAATEPGSECILKGKVTSTVGLTELVPVRRVGDAVEPLASKYLPLATLAHADGWIVVPAASEGLAAGTRVTVRPLP